MKTLCPIAIIVSALIISQSTAWSQSRRGTEGRQQTRIEITTESLKQSGKTTEDYRGKSGRQETRVNATSQALKQSGNTAEDYRGKSGRQQFRRQVGQAVVVD